MTASAVGSPRRGRGVTDPTEGPPGRPRVAARRRRAVLLVGVWALSSLFYLWTATSSGDPIHVGGSQNDYYNQLADGFLRGELSIPATPPAALVHLADPYDPLQNAEWQVEFHDLSLYDGHLYLSWGPTPVLLLFIPWRVLGVGELPQNLAALLFSVVGLGFTLALLELLVRRYFDRVSTARVGLAALALAASSVVPYLLRRVAIYEVALACAYCCVAGGLWLLAVAFRSRRWRRTGFGLGSLALGLSVGARFEEAVVVIIVAATALAVDRTGRAVALTARLRRVAPVVVPFSLAVLAVLAYNFARFHNPLQIGSSYQLAGFDPTTAPFVQPGYVAPNLYYYVIAPVRLTLAFPFVALSTPGAYPYGVSSAYHAEVVGGLVMTTPALVVLFLATFIIGGTHASPSTVTAAGVGTRLPPGDRPLDVTARRLPGVRPELVRVVAVLVATALALVVAIAIAVPGATQRYEVDFATPLILSAALVWFAWRPARRSSRVVVEIAMAAAVLAGAAAGVALSVTGPTDQMNLANHAAYDRLSDDFAFVPTVLTKLEGRARVVRIVDPRAGYPDNLGDFGTYMAGSLRFTLLTEPEEIDIVAPDRGRYRLEARVERTASAPVRGSVTIAVKVGARTTTVPLRYGRSLVIDAELSEGLNRVVAWATVTGSPPSGGLPDLVNLYGLDVTAMR